MPRHISFAMTTTQFINQTKDVTRRIGWRRLKAGVDLWGVEKGMGLKKGEKAKKLGLIHVVSTRGEPLDAITKAECIREGFPDMDPADFVAMFCKHNNCQPGDQVTRIEFIYL